MSYKIYKDKVLIAEGEQDTIIYEYVHKHHSYSVTHAVKYEGYTIEFNGEDITYQFK